MQKNSGNKGAKRRKDIGAGAKNHKEILRIFDFVRDQDGESLMRVGTYVAKITRKLGNGRVQVFYLNERNEPCEEQAIIRGSFRGKGKRDIWIDINTVVVIEENINILEIIAVLTPDQLKDLADYVFIDERIYVNGSIEDDIFDKPENTEETTPVIIDKRNKVKHHKETELEDADIDEI